MKPQPFFFDTNIFDDDVTLSEEERAKQPEFSRIEIEDARKSAYEEGKKAGFNESQDSLTSTIVTLLQKLEQDIGVLFAAEEKRQEEFLQSATHLAAQVFTKAFPVYMQAHGGNELRAAVIKALSNHMVPESIQLELNNDVIGPFSKFLEKETISLQKKMTFKPDPTLPEYACRISWPGGGLLCDRNTLTKKIFNILDQSLAEHDVNLHDKNVQDTDTVHGKKEDDEATTSGESIDE